jgi:hypothetical protein
MTPLQITIKAALSGAVADDIPDEDFLEVLQTIAADADPELVTEEAAPIVGKSPVTLKKWRAKGIGPRYRKDLSGFVYYRMSWLREFNEQGEVVNPQNSYAESHQRDGVNRA